MTDLPLIRELLLPSTYCGNVTETLPRSAPIRPPHFAGREIEYLMAGWKKYVSGPSSTSDSQTPATFRKISRIPSTFRLVSGNF